MNKLQGLALAVVIGGAIVAIFIGFLISIFGGD